MGWRDVVHEIQSDVQDRKEKESASLHRSALIANNWEKLWSLLITALRQNAEQLNRELHAAKILSFGNDVAIVDFHKHAVSFQNPAFPKIDINIQCHPGRGVSANSTSMYSGLLLPEGEKLENYLFGLDDDLKPCFVSESGYHLHPSEVADRFTDKVGDFFRKAVNNRISSVDVSLA